MAAIHSAMRALEQYTAAGTLQLEMVEGIPFIMTSGGKENVKDLRSRFSLRPSDVFLIGFPKTGSTWLMHTVYRIRNNGVEDGRDANEAIPIDRVYYLCYSSARIINPRRN